jgi:hypothetical protein
VRLLPPRWLPHPGVLTQPGSPSTPRLRHHLTPTTAPYYEDIRGARRAREQVNGFSEQTDGDGDQFSFRFCFMILGIHCVEWTERDVRACCPPAEH